MIIKSLSRKSPTFGQLAAYMASEKSDERFDIHRNCYSRRHEHIAAEFFENSKRLSKRKNANFLYHEIISLSVPEGVDLASFKETLRDIVDLYIEARCSRNMVYGCLHEDHRDHIHYHLMISSNERGESRRLRLTKSRFDEIKRGLELHTLEKHPELMQNRIITADREERSLSHKAAEVKRKGGKLERQDFARRTLYEVMAATRSIDEFRDMLRGRQFEYYRRGKHHGVAVSHPDGRQEKYRFNTLGIAADFETYRENLEQLSKARVHPEPIAEGKKHEPLIEEKEEEMRRHREDGLKKPSPERREHIDKGHVQPDPERDLMSHEDWRDQDKFMTKVQQSWRRTMDDLRGRSKDLEGRAQGKNEDDAERDR